MAFAASPTPVFPDEHQRAAHKGGNGPQIIKLRLGDPLNKGNVGDFRAPCMSRDRPPLLTRI
jgi:hypothetical protein